MKNAGKNPEAIMIEMGYYSDIPNVGYDARNDKYVDMISEGIIDPTKVTRTALENANSVASILLTTEAVVTKEPTEKKEVSQPEMMY
jgi:chaperonin GroEL